MPTLRIDDVPEDVLAILRKRAETEDVSLPDYIRILLIMEAEKPEPWTEKDGEELETGLRALKPVEVTDEEILRYIHEGRRE
jgi:hypothetical protein